MSSCHRLPVLYPFPTLQAHKETINLDFWISLWGWDTKENTAVFNVVIKNLTGFRHQSESCHSEVSCTGSGADQGD